MMLKVNCFNFSLITSNQTLEQNLENGMDEKILLETMEGFDEDAYLERMNRT